MTEHYTGCHWDHKHLPGYDDPHAYITIKYINAGLNEFVSDDARSHMTGVVAWHGRTVEFEAEYAGGEYGGWSVSFQWQPEPVDDIIRDMVTDRCSEILADAYGAAVKGWADAISLHSGSTMREEYPNE